MGTSLPVIRGTSALLYPVEVTVSYRTVVGRFQNGAQQRSIGNPGALIQVSIPNHALTLAQKNIIMAAVTAAKGQFSTNLTLTTGSASYLIPGLGAGALLSNFSFDADEFAATEKVTTQYDAPLKLSQTISQSLSPGTPGQPFPMLANSTMCVLPYTQKKNFQSVVTKLDSGPKYATPEFAGGFAGYPNDGLMSWTLAEKRLSDADVATRMAHFIANYGRAYAFQFTDETQAPLSAAVTTSSAGMPFATDPVMSLGQVIQIASERMQVTGAYSAGAVPVTRAFDGTAAAAHASGAIAFWVYLSAHYSTDSLTFKYNAPNDSEVTIAIEAVNNYPN